MESDSCVQQSSKNTQKKSRSTLGGVLWVLWVDGSGVEVLQSEELNDLVEVLDAGAIQVLLVVIERVPHGREGGRDEVQDAHT